MNIIRILSVTVIVGATLILAKHNTGGTHPLARTCLLEPDGRTAVELCKTALLSDELRRNERGDVAFAIGYLLHDADPEQSIAYYTLASTVYPEKTSAFQNRGMQHQKNGDHALAIADFTVAIDRMEAGGRQYDHVYWRRATAYRDFGLTYPALDDYEKQVAHKLAQGGVYMDRAKLYRDIGDFDLAIADLARAAEVNPDDTALLVAHFEVLKEQEDYAAMMPVFEAALQNTPEDPWWWRQKSWAEGKLHDYEAALASIDRAIWFGSGTRWTWSHRAWTNRNLGNFTEAYGDYQKAFAIDPDHAWTRTDVRTWIDQIRVAAAQEDADIDALLGPLLLRWPDQYELLRIAIPAYYNAGRHEHGLSLMNGFLEQHSDHHLAKIMRANMLILMGHPDEAMVDLDWVIWDADPDGRRHDDARYAELWRPAENDYISRPVHGRDIYIRALTDRSAAHVQLGNELAALADQNLLIDDDPENAEKRLARAEVLSGYDHHRAAIEDLTMAIDLVDAGKDVAGNDANVLRVALMQRANLYTHIGRGLAAFDDVERVFRQFPETVELAKKFYEARGIFNGDVNGELTPALMLAVRTCIADTSCPSR